MYVHRQKQCIPVQLRERAGGPVQRHDRPREPPLRPRLQAHHLRSLRQYIQGIYIGCPTMCHSFASKRGYP